MKRQSTTRKLTKNDNPIGCIVRHKGIEYGCIESYSAIGYRTLICQDGEGNIVHLTQSDCTIRKATPVWTSEQLEWLQEPSSSVLEFKFKLRTVISGPMDYATHDTF